MQTCCRAFAQCGSDLVKEPFDNPDYIFELKHDEFERELPEDKTEDEDIPF